MGFPGYDPQNIWLKDTSRKETSRINLKKKKKTNSVGNSQSTLVNHRPWEALLWKDMGLESAQCLSSLRGHTTLLGRAQCAEILQLPQQLHRRREGRAPTAWELPKGQLRTIRPQREGPAPWDARRHVQCPRSRGVREISQGWDGQLHKVIKCQREFAHSYSESF